MKSSTRGRSTADEATGIDDAVEPAPHPATGGRDDRATPFGKLVLLAMLVALAAGVAVGVAAGSGTSKARASRTTAVNATLVADLALARAATARYVGDLPQARADGYQIITRMLPNMGYHYMNPKVKGFDLRKPPILVYEHRGAHWQLGALEWVFTSKPAKPPIPGAHYGVFGAGCHYTDGTFVPATAQGACPKKAPQTAAAFSFWHPLLITMHVWVWYPNPTGLFASTNPLVAAFNRG